MKVVDDTTVKLDMPITFSAAHELTFSLQRTTNRVGYRLENSQFGPTDAAATHANTLTSQLNRTTTGDITTLYAQHRLMLGTRLFATPGIRVSEFSGTGERYVEPRLNAPVIATGSLPVNGAPTATEQYGRDRSPPKGRSDLWRFDGSAWQNVAADFGMPAEPVASLGFDYDGRLWILVGGRGSQGPKQLYFLPPGEKRVQKAGENLLVDYLTLDADQHVLTSPEPRPGQPGSWAQAALPAYPILRADSDQILDRENAVWVFAKGCRWRAGRAKRRSLV